MPSAAVRVASMDLPVVKAKISKGLVAKLMTVGIVRIVVVLISESLVTFLQSRHRARAFRPWAMLGHHVLHEAVPALGRRARMGCCRPFSFF